MTQQTNETEAIDKQHDNATNSTTKINASETSMQNEVVEQIVEVVEWSAPDTLGNQYAVKTVRTTTNMQRGTRNNKQSTMSNTTNSHSTTANHTERTKTETKKTKAYNSKQTEIKTPSWVHTTILGIIIAVLIVVLIVLKRYRII